MSSAVIQSAVNVSEGRRQDVIDRIVAAADSVSGALVANWSADPDHNRMVVTILGNPRAVGEAILTLAQVAVAEIDMRSHEGFHPRTGAVDVVPFTPLRSVTMQECIDLSHQVGSKLSRDLGIPIYLYEQSARIGRPLSLPELRRGGYEAISAVELVGDRAPDYGGNAAHPTAGICIVGARLPLVAYNVDLDSVELSISQSIARSIRTLRNEIPILNSVRAIGLFLPRRGCAQVSMNLTKPDLTHIPSIFEFIRAAASELGCGVRASEIIGLVPKSCIETVLFSQFMWHDGSPDQIVETWLKKIR
jgi:glutamate formiminotransferase